MIRIDPNKVRHVTEPGCFGDMSQDYDCITLSYANELVAQANSQVEQFCHAVVEADNESISEATPLTKENAAAEFEYWYNRGHYKNIIEIQEFDT